MQFEHWPDQLLVLMIAVITSSYTTVGFSLDYLKDRMILYCSFSIITMVGKEDANKA